MEEYYREQLAVLLRGVRPADENAMRAAARRWDGIAKPIGGLGELEQMIIKLAGIRGSEEVSLARKGVVVFCADNGVVAEGVSQTDSSVTAVVAENFARGIASVNRMATVAGADVLPVDIGVAADLQEPGIRSCKLGRGTANLYREPAMTAEQALAGIHTGIAIAGELKDAGYDILAVGEMGIGNTTTSSAIACIVLGEEPEAVTGRGSGLSDEGLRRKLEVIRGAITLHHPDPSDAIAVLSAVGGFDIAGITGLMLGGAIYHIPVVLDGMITAASALLAQLLCPQVTDYLLASHLGREPLCVPAMQRLGLRPVIRADLALGEGTGAVLLFPMLDQALAVYGENCTFADIRIDAYRRF